MEGLGGSWVLLGVLVLLGGGGQGAPSPPSTLLILQESIRLLSTLQDTQVSCAKMKVTDVFAGDKPDPLHTLCKATTVALQGRSCHRALEGLYLNLLQLIPKRSSAFQVPCPVPGGSSTTSLSHFLLDFRRLLQQIVKEERLK